MNKAVQKLTVSSVMIALGTILSFITVFRMPYGGEITPFSMVPVLFIGYIYGIKTGFCAGLVFGLLQALFGAVTSSAFAGLNALSVMGVCFLDYAVAFTVLGLSGIYKEKIKSPSLSIGLGAFTATFLRYIVHTVSGVIIYGSYAEWFFSQENITFGASILNRYSGVALAIIYSVIYNGSYLIPEIILSVIGCMLLIKIPFINKLCKTEKISG